MASLNNRTTRNPIVNSIYIGIVKGNNDPQKMGRLSVWIPELGGDPSSEGSWYIVSYASPFAGATPASSLRKDGTSMEDAQQSYGLWMQPPDLENQVLVCFANNDKSKGFWFACLWQQNMNHMVPGIASSKTTQGGTEPSVEYNKRSDANIADPQRAVFAPLSDALKNQGLDQDGERGFSSSSARRESPSKVYGLLSPRGNQLYIDDEENNEFIRMRTRSGAQVLVHNTTGYVYINSKNGASWIEISDTAIDIYSQNTINLRSQNDLNLTSDKNVNISAGQSVNILATEGIFATSQTFQAKASGELVMDAGGNLSLKSAANVVASAGGTLSGKGGGDVIITAGGNNVRTGASILDNSGGGSAADGASAQAATDTTRKPAHEPWEGHPEPTSFDDEGHDGANNVGASGGSGGSGGSGSDFVPSEALAAAEQGEGSWLIPTSGRVGSQFGPRIHPISGKRKHHAGVDISRNDGQPIYATRGGTVKTAGRAGGYGNFVEVDHGNGLTSRHGHLKSISVRSGAIIRQGAVIGHVGSTGGSTGPHLHFEITFRGTAVNPKSFIPELGTVGTTVRGGTKSGGR